MSTKPQKSSDFGSWIPIVVLFCIPNLWPIALILLIRKLLGADKKRKPTHPYDIQKAAQEAQAAAQANPTRVANANPARSTAKAKTTSKAKAAKGNAGYPNGRGLTIAGGIVTGIFGFAFFMQFVEALSWGGLEYMVFELSSLLGFLCLGLVLLLCGVGRTRRGRRWRSYLPLIGKRPSVSLDALVKTSGHSRHRVLDDLQDMLDAGVLPTGYVDFGREVLVLSDAGIPDEEPAPAPQPEPKPEPAPEQDADAILREIRAVNDAIPDPVMSEKIDRIGTITARILDYQRRNPGKDSQLRSFLNYYLPTTLKILRTYAQLDAQGVEGENITAAKARIEGMMDNVVSGFEQQLDRLFRDSAMDISSDIAVLEQMLAKDGLTGDPMTMPSASGEPMLFDLPQKKPEYIPAEVSDTKL